MLPYYAVLHFFYSKISAYVYEMYKELGHNINVQYLLNQNQVVHMFEHTYMNACSHTRTHTHTHTNTQTYTCAYTHTHTHVHSHTCTLTHMYTHTRSSKYLFSGHTSFTLAQQFCHRRTHALICRELLQITTTTTIPSLPHLLQDFLVF